MEGLRLWAEEVGEVAAEALDSHEGLGELMVGEEVVEAERRSDWVDRIGSQTRFSVCPPTIDSVGPGASDERQICGQGRASSTEWGCGDRRLWIGELVAEMAAVLGGGAEVKEVRSGVMLGGVVKGGKELWRLKRGEEARSGGGSEARRWLGGSWRRLVVLRGVGFGGVVEERSSVWWLWSLEIEAAAAAIWWSSGGGEQEVEQRRRAGGRGADRVGDVAPPSFFFLWFPLLAQGS